MTTWEYRLIPIGGDEPLRRLREAGLKGWEAVALEHGHALCKRPVPPTIAITAAPPSTSKEGPEG